MLRYGLDIAARNYFELNVFKPAIKNPETRALLDLGIGQSVFDQCVFEYILFLCIFCILSLMSADSIRFPDSANPQFCPLQFCHRKEVRPLCGVQRCLGFEVPYSTPLHYTIAHSDSRTVTESTVLCPRIREEGRRLICSMSTVHPGSVVCIAEGLFSFYGFSDSFMTATTADTFSARSAKDQPLYRAVGEQLSS